MPFFPGIESGRLALAVSRLGWVEGRDLGNERGSHMTHEEAKHVTDFLVNARPEDKMEAVLPPVPQPGVVVTSVEVTILVVDDDEWVRAVARDTLTGQGFSVLTATDGRHAVDLFRRCSVEITAVLLDMTMPGLGGEAVFAELHSIDSTAKVVLMSGYSQHTAAQRLVDQGLASFLEKPFLPDELLQALRDLRPAA